MNDYSFIFFFFYVLAKVIDNSVDKSEVPGASNQQASRISHQIFTSKEGEHQ
jgi:hypothetical protein